MLVWVLFALASFLSSHHAVKGFQRRDGRARQQSYHTTSKSGWTPWTSGSKKVVGILTRCPTASKPQRSVSVSMVTLSFSGSVTELPPCQEQRRWGRKASHRDNNNWTQLTSQGLSYFVTTVDLLDVRWYVNECLCASSVRRGSMRSALSMTTLAHTTRIWFSF